MKVTSIGIATVLSCVGVMALAWPLPYWRLQLLGLCFYAAIRGTGWLAEGAALEKRSNG